MATLQESQAWKLNGVELGILAVLRFDISDSACTGSTLGSNTTLDAACTSSIGVQVFRGPIL